MEIKNLKEVEKQERRKPRRQAEQGKMTKPLSRAPSRLLIHFMHLGS